jgi:hypothetical protein
MSRLALYVVITCALVVLPASGRAATMAATAPLLGTEFVSGRLRCLAVNVDAKPRTLVSMELIGTNGSVLYAHPGPVLVAPGQIELSTFADLSLVNPAFCRFVYQGKFRASLMYYNGIEMEVIPATTK